MNRKPVGRQRRTKRQPGVVAACGLIAAVAFSAPAVAGPKTLTVKPGDPPLVAAAFRRPAVQTFELAVDDRPDARQLPTSVDHEFTRPGLVGSAGFLCGRAPGHNETGGAAAYGYDPQGRFVGARLSYAF